MSLTAAAPRALYLLTGALLGYAAAAFTLVDEFRGPLVAIGLATLVGALAEDQRQRRANDAAP